MPLEQRLAEQFMLVYKKWRTDGEPPDDPSVTDAGNEKPDEE
jgi:hypothetical protein